MYSEQASAAIYCTLQSLTVLEAVRGGLSREQLQK